MIIQTPIQSADLNLSPEGYDGLILARYPGYEACFLAFHPFLKIRPGHENVLELLRKLSWPSKKTIEEQFERFSWTDFLKISGINGYINLDQVIAFYHCAYHYANKIEYEKFVNTLQEHPDIVVPFVEDLPEILAFEVLRFIRNKGYSKVYIYTDIEEKSKLFDINDLISGTVELPFHVRIETPNEEILVVQDFDQRFSYFLGTKPVVDELIEKIDLEGFFCDKNTMGCWSYEEIAELNRVDWDQAKSMNPEIFSRGY